MQIKRFEAPSVQEALQLVKRDLGPEAVILYTKKVKKGGYLGLTTDVAIGHLNSLGVTTVELMPVHEHVDEPAVVARGLTNYWGYSSLAFFAPDRRFATRGGDAMREFKEMVKVLHAAGIEAQVAGSTGPCPETKTKSPARITAV